MTRQQSRLLAFLRAPRDYSPSYSEMATALGLKSKAGIHRLVLALESQGKIKRLAHRARSVEVIA